MALKTLNHEKKVKLQRVFTDRVEPRKLFWDNYTYLKENIHNDESKVISYYGIGGVGKTTLCKKIIEEIDTKYIYYDFNISQDYKEILTHMKEDLKCRYNFTFPLFEYGLYCYAIKCGHNPVKKEAQGIIQNSSFLSFVFKVADTIPFVSNVSNILKNLDDGAVIIKNFFEKFDTELSEIEVSDINTILTMLPTFFATDLNNNLKDETSPFVIILDTYEKLVNELSSLNDSLYNDLWLRNTKNNNEGIIIRTPKILWVIAGREKLKWHDLNSIWDEDALEQYNLGNLSETDSIYYLKKANITNDELCKGLYDLTNGVPVHLDLCVEQYETMINNNKTPSITDFGNNIDELANNFFKYLDDEMNDILYILTCIEKWTDNIFYNVSSFFKFAISPTKYEKIKNLSFVLTKDNINYMFHQKIQEVLFLLCPKQIKLNYINYINDITIETSYRQRTFSAPTVMLPRSAKNLILKKDPYNSSSNQKYEASSVIISAETCDTDLKNEYRRPDNLSLEDKGRHYLKKLDLELSLNTDICDLYHTYKDFLIKCIDTYNFYTFEKIFDKLWSKVSKENLATREYILYEELYILYLVKKGNLSKASIFMGVIERIYQDADLTKEEILFSKQCLSTINNYLGNYEISLKLNEELYKKYSKLYGKYDTKTLTILHYLGTSYSRVGKEKKALKLRLILYKKMKEVLGEHNLKTIRSFYRIGLSYINLGMYDQALDVFNKTLNFNRNIFGEEHPNTLKDLHNIGKIYYFTHKYDEALNILKDVYNKRSRYLGRNHQDALRTQFYIGLIYKETKDYDNARTVLEIVYRQRGKYIGKSHPDTLKTLSSLNSL